MTRSKLSMILALTLSSLLAACGGGGSNDSVTPVPPVTPTSPAEADTVALTTTNVGDYAAANDAIAVKWTSNKANCNGDAGIVGTVAGSGQITYVFPVAGDMTFQITCGGATQSVTIHVLTQTPEIPDPAFQSALTSLGLTVINNQVKTADALKLTTMGIASGEAAGVALAHPITDLTGLENFKNLTILQVEDQQLTSLDLTVLPQLVGAKLSNNGLTNVSVQGLASLKTLDVSNNALTSLDLSGTSIGLVTGPQGLLTTGNAGLTQITVKNAATETTWCTAAAANPTTDTGVCTIDSFTTFVSGT